MVGVIGRLLLAVRFYILSSFNIFNLLGIFEALIGLDRWIVGQPKGKGVRLCQSLA